MTLPVYRLVKAKRRNEAFSGAGGTFADSRWTSRGRPVVFAAESMALALLEFTVHHRRRNWIPSSVIIKARIPDDITPESVALDDLPADWREEISPPQLREIGNDWFDRGVSLLLRVPSAIVPAECNYLINPTHPDFRRIEIGEPEEFIIDGRLVRTARTG